MKRFLLVSCLLAAGLIVPVAGHAQATTCTWQRTELPVPAPHSGPSIAGIGGDYVVGYTNDQGFLWHKGQVKLLVPPSTDPNRTARVADVNSSGTVTGTLHTTNNDGTYSQDAYITRPDGTHQMLASVRRNEHAVAINDRGDVVGYTVDWNNHGNTQVVLWQAKDYTKPRILVSGSAAGVDNSGRVVTVEGLLITPLDNGLAVGRRLQKPAGTDWVAVTGFEGATIVGNSARQNSFLAVTWNANGSVRWVTEGRGYAANSAGSVVGLQGPLTPMFWRAEQPLGMPSPAPMVAPGHVFVGDQDVMTGTYFAGNEAVAAQWRCI